MGIDTWTYCSCGLSRLAGSHLFPEPRSILKSLFRDRLLQQLVHLHVHLDLLVDRLDILRVRWLHLDMEHQQACPVAGGSRTCHNKSAEAMSVMLRLPSARVLAEPPTQEPAKPLKD